MAVSAAAVVSFRLFSLKQIEGLSNKIESKEKVNNVVVVYVVECVVSDVVSFMRNSLK